MNREETPRCRPKAVIIRGDWLSRRDTQYYEPLLDRYDLVGVSVRRTAHDLSLVGFPVATPWSPDSLLAKLGPLQYLTDRATGLRTENLMYFWGLGEICGAASIIDVAETFHPFCLQAVRIKQRTGARLVFRVHENIPFAHHNLAYRRHVKTQVFRFADAFIACSELGRHTLEAEGAPPDRIHVIPIGTDVGHYCPDERDRGLMEDLRLTERDFVVLFVGRVVWEKGVIDLLNAAAVLTQDLPDLRVLIVGDGPDFGKLTQRIALRGLEQVVRVIGKVPLPRVRDFYSISDLVAVPSIATPTWQEQFGAVIIEAMACGKALVVSDSGAIPEVVADAAVVVPQANYLDLARAILKLSRDRDLRAELGNRARLRAVKKFSNEAVATRIGAIYDALLQRDYAIAHCAKRPWPYRQSVFRRRG